MKLCVVGGGSTYTPELVDGIARLRDTLPVSELALVDPDERRLELVGGFSRRIFARYGHPGVIRTTTVLDEGVEGAGAVLLQLRVGGQAARHVDETLPLTCGCIGQETTGAGGLAKALRTVPLVLDIADRVAELAPDAWIVDFTNPVGIVTRALLDAGHRAVGLCNVAIGFQRRFAKTLGVPASDIQLGHVGLNHLTWERSVLLRGEDVLPQLLDRHAEELASGIGLPPALLRRLGVVPSYYLRYFYEHDAVVAEQLSAPSRAEEVTAIEERLLEMYADPALDEKPTLLEERGGAYYSEAAVDLVASLSADRGDVQVVNVRNGDRLPFLPAEAVIEVPARITAAGADPLPVDPVEPLYAGLIAHVTAYEELAIEAALKGGVDRVTDALLAHPLIGQVSMATDLADRLVTANAAYLHWAVDA
ncbi:6-phospho-beta-glucosidase [Actinoallomurus bryophytorum]|uniref:6-phospho-beta-glucosidase n=1 Tax=Actinoallomurus bryophytorum TaxID=1490222 RepID=A0A543BTT9_9ACTN|nr:6-phospho-beta-glucosidase [Actinoallomurus bryophytorum]TQL88166.1 6-phospho-beta-glucosidase [Actinoallomurus bryophytorum]